jgi:histidinol-phosphate/aromatic aminotransferase/cobyric acid decarboxylase-like protein
MKRSTLNGEPAMPTPARQHLDRTLHNPFPGVAALQRTLGRPIISRLSGNEAVALYPGKWLRTYREDFLTRCREYPDPSAYSLCHAIARNMRVGLEEVLVDAGADSLIHLTLRAFTNTGDKVLSSTGTLTRATALRHPLRRLRYRLAYRSAWPAGSGMGCPSQSRVPGQPG